MVLYSQPIELSIRSGACGIKVKVRSREKSGWRVSAPQSIRVEAERVISTTGS